MSSSRAPISSNIRATSTVELNNAGTQNRRPEDNNKDDDGKDEDSEDHGVGEDTLLENEIKKTTPGCYAQRSVRSKVGWMGSRY